jgi:hypothetical protein
MIINHSLASLFLRNGREKVRQRGWAGYENGVLRKEDFRMYDMTDDEETMECGKRPVTGCDAIHIAMFEYEILSSPHLPQVTTSWNGEEFKTHCIRSDTLNSYNLAITYYIASLAEMFNLVMGDEASLARYKASNQNVGYSKWLGNDDVLKAFDFAIESVKAQVRSYPHLVTMAPLAIKRYKEELSAMAIPVDKLLKLESERWNKGQLMGDGPKRKITVKDESID